MGENSCHFHNRSHFRYSIHIQGQPRSGLEHHRVLAAMVSRFATRYVEQHRCHRMESWLDSTFPLHIQLLLSYHRLDEASATDSGIFMLRLHDMQFCVCLFASKQCPRNASTPSDSSLYPYRRVHDSLVHSIERGLFPAIPVFGRDILRRRNCNPGSKTG